MAVKIFGRGIARGKPRTLCFLLKRLSGQINRTRLGQLLIKALPIVEDTATKGKIARLKTDFMKKRLALEKTTARLTIGAIKPLDIKRNVGN